MPHINIPLNLETRLKDWCCEAGVCKTLALLREVSVHLLDTYIYLIFEIDIFASIYLY
jgi:hypothetical protein